MIARVDVDVVAVDRQLCHAPGACTGHGDDVTDTDAVDV
jgi:uncharacterized UPF0146 family protein